MKVIVVYNMKGGVGKTTAAVNLSYLAAASGQRTLLWDLDPQGAASFAFRVRPRVAGFGKRNLEQGQLLAAAIKETDYQNLDLLPADFAYRKIDRLLDRLGKPERVVARLIDTLGRDYDTVFLDCPAGFSLLTEGILAAADVVLVPTIPSVLSLRMVARLIKWAKRAGSTFEVAAFFSMADRRKVLHRHACEWSRQHQDIFLAGEIPYASIVEQMTVRRMPLAAFAPREEATAAFDAIAVELQRRVNQLAKARGRRAKDGWERPLRAIESLIGQLESQDGEAPRPRAAIDAARRLDAGTQLPVVHSFDTSSRDLQRANYVLEMHETEGNLLVVAGRGGEPDGPMQAEARIDSSWATQILAGELSPLEALERRLGRPLEHLRAVVGYQIIRRIASRGASPRSTSTVVSAGVPRRRLG